MSQLLWVYHSVHIWYAYQNLNIGKGGVMLQFTIMQVVVH